MEIYIKQFKKKFVVKSSNRNMLATYRMQETLAKSQDLAEKDVVEQIKDVEEMTVGVMEYIKNVLRLNDKQVNVLEDMESNETVELANHIAMRLMGVSEADVKKSLNSDIKSKG